MFRTAFKRSRCLIPASGYYEWKATSAGKQPYYISAHDASVLSFAGLWDEWRDIETGEAVKSCTIIVTDANALTRQIHERMPLVIAPEQFEPRLTGVAGTELLKSAPEEMLQMWPISRKRLGGLNFCSARFLWINAIAFTKHIASGLELSSIYSQLYFSLRAC